MTRKFFTPEELRAIHVTTVKWTSSWEALNYEDTSQELSAYLLKDNTYKNLQKYRAQGKVAPVYTALENEMLKYIHRQKITFSSRLNQRNKDIMFNREIIQNTLPILFSQEHRALNTFDNELAERIYNHVLQVSQGFNKLPKKSQDLLIRYYHEGYTFKEIGEMQGVLEDAARKQHDNIIKILQDNILNTREFYELPDAIRLPD